MANRQQHIDDRVRPFGIAHARVGERRPARRVRVLRAVFANARRIRRDIARIAFSIERRREQPNGGGFFIHQLFPYGVHRRCAPAGIQPRQHRPCLRNHIDPAADVVRAAQMASFVIIGAQIPFSVPAAGFHRSAHSIAQRGKVCAVFSVRRDGRIFHCTYRHEFAQPYAFAAPLRADAVHAVVPIAAAHQRKAVFAGSIRASEGAHDVLMQAFAYRGRLHFAVKIAAAIGNRHILKIRNAHV